MERKCENWLVVKVNLSADSLTETPTRLGMYRNSTHDTHSLKDSEFVVKVFNKKTWEKQRLKKDCRIFWRYIISMDNVN